MTTEIEAALAEIRAKNNERLASVARLRNSHTELLAAAKEALDYLARGKVDRVDDVLRAAIANAKALP